MNNFIVFDTADAPMEYDEDEESDSALLDNPVEETDLGGTSSSSTLAVASPASRRGKLFSESGGCRFQVLMLMKLLQD